MNTPAPKIQLKTPLLQPNVTGAKLFEQYSMPAILCALVLWVIGALPEFIVTENQEHVILLFASLQEMVGALFFGFFAYKVKRDFLPQNTLQFSFLKIVVLVFISLAMWFLNHFHLVLATLGVASETMIPIVLITAIATLYLLGFYFFFIPYLFEGASLVTSLSEAQKQVPSPRLAAVRIIATTLILSLAVQQFFSFFTAPGILPVAYHKIFLVLADSANGIGWIISIFMALGYVANKFSPSAIDNLTPTPLTISAFAGYGIARYIVMLVMVGVATTYLTLSVPPTFSVKVKSAEYNKTNSELVLSITVEDSTNTLESVQPAFFRIAGENGFALSEVPLSVTPQVAIQEMAKGARTVDLTMIFKIINRSDDFEMLKDKSLYYITHELTVLP